MEKLRTLLGAVSLATAMASASCTYITNAYDTTPGSGGNAQTQQDERPNYLQSLPSQEAIDAMSPLQKRVEALRQLARGYMNGEQDIPFTIYINGCARADLDVNGSIVHLYLPFYEPASEGKWRYIPGNTLVDSQPILDDMEAVFEDGVNLAYEEYAGHSGRSNRVAERAYPNAERDKDNPIANTELVNNDIFGLIDIEGANFLPDGARIIFAPDEAGIYAITQLERNTILYTPDARRSDAIWGRAYVFAHELVHNNTLLQNVPNLLENDLELQAHILNIADRSNLFLFLKHSYSAPLRESALRYFGVDASAIYNNLIKLQFNNYIEIDEQYLSQAAPVIVDMVDKFHSVMMEYSMPEYQGFMPWWLMAEAYFKNDALPLEVGMAARFTPTTLTSQQMQKITQNTQQIERMIDEARADYTMPAETSFLGMTFTDGDTFKDAILNRAINAGYDEQQSDYIYDMAMERVFIAENRINYGALSVDNAIEGMKDFMDSFDGIMTTEGRDLSRALRDIASKPDVIRRYAAYQWMQDRLETAKRYIGFAERRGQNPSTAFAPAILDPRVELSAHYNVAPRMPENAPPSSETGYSTGGLNYRIELYDLNPNTGFNENEPADFAQVFHEGDSVPCIVAYAEGEKFGSHMLVDYGTNGRNTDGVFDEMFSISGTEDVLNMLKGQKPDEE